MSALASRAGIDTVRFRWREEPDIYQRFSQRPEGVIEGYRGERYAQTELGRIGVYRDGMVYLEGRAGAILHRNREDHSLLPSHALSSAERVARYFVQENGADVSEEARLGRIDLASELRFSDPREGSAFLHSLAGLDVPWCKSRVDGRKGDHIETVSFHGTRGRSIYLRAYDKGVESGTAPPGEVIRMERQRRFRKSREVLADDFSNVADLRKVFLGREFKLLADLPSAMICNLPDALLAMRDMGLRHQQFERLGGFLTVGRYIDYPRAIRYKRIAELREMGIFVDPAQNERLEVPVGQYLQTLASAWAA